MWQVIFNLGLVCFVVGTGFWLVFQLILPLWRLEKMVSRIRAGEPVRAWKVGGAAPIRRAAQSLENLGQELNRVKNEADLSSEQLAVLFRQMESGVAIVNDSGGIVQMNEAFVRIFNLPEKFEGKRLIDLLQVFEINEALTQAQTSRQPVKVDSAFEVIDGDVLATRNVGFSAVPLRSGKNGADGECLLMAVDYSRLRQMESQERQMTGSVSHELRTPLSVFKGYLEALEDAEADGKPETRRMIAVLNRHSRRLNHLVEDLLALSRLEEGHARMEWESIHVEKFFERLARDCRQFLKDGVVLEWEVEDGVDLVGMDEFRIEQVFHNLIDNAQRHSDSSRPIRMGVRKSEAGDEHHFFVRDEGRGIPSDQLNEVFRRFYRIDRARSRERGGTGLGLTIVDEIVRAHGGRAWIESTLGEGTTIWFSLPPAPSEPAPKSSPTRA